jgi:hypothetical protein
VEADYLKAKTSRRVLAGSLTLCLLAGAVNGYAEVYSYTNADGDYVVSQSKPKDHTISYAVLSDEGEFIRMVEGRGKQVPITHWRPFFLPKEPDPMDGPQLPIEDKEPVVNIDEIEPADD